MLPIYNVLTPSEVTQIHEAALKVLATVGIAVEHPKAQKALSEAGAELSSDGQRVFLNHRTVETLLARAPKEFLCAAPDPVNDMIMKLGGTYTRQGGGPFSFYDMRNQTSRPLTLADAVNSVKLINALPHINAPSTVTPQDVPVATYDIRAVKTVLENTRKHFWALTTGSKNLRYELEMASVVAGGRDNLNKRPILSGIFCVIAPLKFPADEIDRLILYGDYGINVMTPLTILMGGSAPYTMAGCMTQMTAEFLASVCLCQSLCPGLGQWYYTLFQYLDMKTGLSLTHSPELMVLAAAGAQMSAFYGLPSLANTLLSGDCQPHQVIFHYGINILMGLINGITYQVGAGSLECGNLYSHQSLVIIDEILDYLKAFRNGISITPETLAVEDIAEQADKGEYLSSRLTMKYLRQEKHHRPDLLNCPTLSNWLKDPKTIVDRAEDKVQRILSAAPQSSVLSEEVQRELAIIMEAAENELG
ncbi:MAG: trimethylamine methyltransferase family protein [Deltaproteobacteria bacterium]|jgi:trimethylamine--corrinoid protein Co-methyltransferase|nr:trimethylamine methyltransferase family protein [Deltaproteobacteria bacterium]